MNAYVPGHLHATPSNSEPDATPSVTETLHPGTPPNPRHPSGRRAGASTFCPHERRLRDGRAS
eukprot:6985724-Alexandrium_andersonii.AAC.1